MLYFSLVCFDQLWWEGGRWWEMVGTNPREDGLVSNPTQPCLQISHFKSQTIFHIIANGKEKFPTMFLQKLGTGGTRTHQGEAGSRHSFALRDDQHKYFFTHIQINSTRSDPIVDQDDRWSGWSVWPGWGILLVVKSCCTDAGIFSFWKV